MHHEFTLKTATSSIDALLKKQLKSLVRSFNTPRADGSWMIQADVFLASVSFRDIQASSGQIDRSYCRLLESTQTPLTPVITPSPTPAMQAKNRISL
jgi:hypothetical protein